MGMQSESATIRESRCDAASSNSYVRSVLPSSTNTISCGPPGKPSSTALNRCSSSGKHGIFSDLTFNAFPPSLTLSASKISSAAPHYRARASMTHSYF